MKYAVFQIMDFVIRTVRSAEVYGQVLVQVLVQ